ncbi:MFS monocarboxylate transporter-like protein [Phaeosphaeriaceae sp. PMI808]|nr:MFS monocarboxylate transporter-like protein [Phaeosphaeriaceae sp. PMI808]
MAATKESSHDEEKHAITNAEWQHNLRPSACEEVVEQTAGQTDQSNNGQTEDQLEPNFTRVLSRRSIAASIDPGPPPEGGTIAWIQVLCTHLTILNTFGFFSSFGVYQTYYVNTLGIAPSTVSWIGSFQVFLLFGIGTFTGRATDAGYFRSLYITGAVFQIVGIFTIAESTKVWHLFLSQALCLGIANGLQFCPSMAVVATYFVKKRAFVLGLASLGACTGGVIFPVIVQQCLPRIGFPWTTRIIGFIMLITNLINIALFRTRLPPRKSGPIVDWDSFKEVPYSLYCTGMFFNFWGLYYAFFYIGSYARNVLGASYQESINVLLVQISTGFVFRTLPTFYADKVGSLNVMTPFALVCSIMMYAWVGIKSINALYVFAAIYGSGAAVLQSLWPTIVGRVSKEPELKKTGVRMGMAFTIVSFSSFTGPPLAGAMIQTYNGDYTYANIWAGTSFLVGSCILLATRYSLVGWDWKARI